MNSDPHDILAQLDIDVEQALADQDVRNGKRILNVGKYFGQNRTMEWVVKNDPGYAQWAQRLTEPNANMAAFNAYLRTLPPITLTDEQWATRKAAFNDSKTHSPPHEDGRVYLEVQFKEKEQAKRLGARWDPNRKKWYAPADKVEDLKRYIPK